MSKASSMARLAKLLVLVQVLANAACSEPLTPLEPVIPDRVAEVIGTWGYGASFIVPTTVLGDSVTCEVAGVTITAGNPKLLSGNPTMGQSVYGFDAQASGGPVECTGDSIDDFVQELPAQVAVELRRSLFQLFLDFTIPTPLGLMRLENIADSFMAGDRISADNWSGRVIVDMKLRGRFMAVRR